MPCVKIDKSIQKSLSPEGTNFVPSRLHVKFSMQFQKFCHQAVLVVLFILRGRFFFCELNTQTLVVEYYCVCNHGCIIIFWRVPHQFLISLCQSLKNGGFSVYYKLSREQNLAVNGSECAFRLQSTRQSKNKLV